MFTAFLCCWKLFLIQTLSSPNDNFLAFDGLEEVRAQLRHLYNSLSKRGKFVKLRSVVFYKMHDVEGRSISSIEPGLAMCIDRQPPKGIGADTCEKQRNIGFCKARFSGTLKDGLCARTCNLCEIQNFAMRTTFQFIVAKITKNGKRKDTGQSLTVEMQATGQWRHYNTHNRSLGVGLYCRANPFVSHTAYRQVRK